MTIYTSYTYRYNSTVYTPAISIWNVLCANDIIVWTFICFALEKIIGKRYDMKNDPYTILNEYYNNHNQELCNYVSTFIGNDKVSRDLVHDAFVSIMDKYLHLVDADAYHRLIMKILKNSIMSYFRHNKKTLNLDIGIWMEPERFFAVEPYIDNMRCLKKMLEFFSELDNPGRLIIYLNIYENFSITAIAKMTGYNINNIFYWKKKALKELKNKMKEVDCNEKI